MQNVLRKCPFFATANVFKLQIVYIICTYIKLYNYFNITLYKYYLYISNFSKLLVLCTTKWIEYLYYFCQRRCNFNRKRICKEEDKNIINMYEYHIYFTFVFLVNKKIAKISKTSFEIERSFINHK